MSAKLYRLSGLSSWFEFAVDEPSPALDPFVVLVFVRLCLKMVGARGYAFAAPTFGLVIVEPVLNPSSCILRCCISRSRRMKMLSLSVP